MNDSEKIWRYMDLPKFLSFIMKSALYFPSPIHFIDDPWEGYIPKALLKSISNKLIGRQNELNNTADSAILELQQNLNLNQYHPDFSLAKAKINHINKIKEDIQEGNESVWETSLNDLNENHGVNCWHKNEHESEAMWKLYSAKGQGIAIESTIKQLEESITCERKIFFTDILYYSDAEPANEEYYKRNYLSFKRMSFFHEKEFRAIIELDESEKRQGALIPCNLQKLLNKVHVSPMAEPYLEEVIKEACRSKIENIDDLVIKSKLLNKPDYRLSSLINSL